MSDDTGTAGDEPVATSSWEHWPDSLRAHAQNVLTHLRSGHPQNAVEVLDELLADLLARRNSLADSANRRFEPSTDDRGE